jgi:hypothetical protein
VNAGEHNTSLSDAIDHTHKRGIPLGNDLFADTTGALASSLLVLGALWTFCWWLYRRKVFIRI